MMDSERRRSVSAAMCKTCAFFHPEVTISEVDYSQNDAGECRVGPPRRLGGSGLNSEERSWPVVFPGDWCGSFIPDTDG